jgi:drug/metabolite transporter (DMT)-like permease
VQAELLAALAALSWAVGSLFSAAASSRMGAFAFTRWRLFFALTLLWAMALLTGQWRSLDA